MVKIIIIIKKETKKKTKNKKTNKQKTINTNLVFER